MKNEHKHFLARLLVGAFLVLGLGFWMTNFVVKADSWIVGTITRNNANFLSGAFWDNNPTSGDIIKALYGSGGGQTAYTQNWSGYTSGSCLSGGMNVIATGILPTTLASNTIYVIDSGTYNITTGITMNNCSALISSGIVTLSGNVGGSGTITATNKNNIIIEKIRINQANNGNNGLMIQGGNNLTIRDTQAYNNIGTTNAGLLISGASYITIINAQFYNNANGIYTYNSTNIFGQNIQTRNNQGMGIQVLYGKSIILSGITSYDNNNIGIFLRNSTLITINNLTGNNNVYHGLMVLNSSGNTLHTINVYDNGRRGIFLNSSDQNTLQNIVSIHNENGISISNSTGNILSGVSVYGNYYGGIDFYNTNYTTGNNITSNSSSGCLYLNNSSYNNFANITTINSPDNGVALFQSNNNILSGLISSGNMGHGIYMANSNNNTIYASTIKYNYKVGMVIETGTSNSILYSTFNNNGLIGFDGNGILLSFCSGTIINSGDLSTNQDHGISLDSSTNTQIINSVINNNQDQGIVFTNSSTNSITGSFLSGNNGGLYFLQNSNDNIITNTVNLVSYIGAGTTIFNSTGNKFYLYSGSNIDEYYSSGGYFYTTTYDVFTQTYNNIRLNSYDFAIVTGNTLSVGSSFPVYFKTLGINGIGYDFLSLSGVTSLTVSGANRDGILYTPTTITTGTKLGAIGDSGVASLMLSFVETVEVISGSTNLHMNSGTGTITYHILSGFNGQYLSILQSVDGNNWSRNTLQSGCILDAFKTCYFDTNGDIKLFAFGVPGLFFTGTTQSLSTVISGGYYNTGVSIIFTGDSISNHTINGIIYTGGTLITGNGTYTFLLSNIRGTTTGMKFTIDTIAPTLAGVVSGAYYNHNITITGIDTNFSGFQLSGTWYTGTSLIITGEGVRVVTGYDKAGNFSTGITFTIDKTALIGVGIYRYKYLWSDNRWNLIYRFNSHHDYYMNTHIHCIRYYWKFYWYYFYHR
ncbi:MAG: right-handed parallel beta-helix repeat-containing protein [candidate division SR1 bacterium]|nr:right-handed parallel beta-helix repeat-containing protein [candidate division SR1 bacterium]